MLETSQKSLTQSFEIFSEWCLYANNNNINSYIIRFLSENTEYFSIEEYNYSPNPTPRAWQQLSTVMCGKTDVNDIILFIDKYGSSYVGASAASAFSLWLNSNKDISIN